MAFLTYMTLIFQGSFPGGSVVKNPPASVGDMGSVPGLGRSPGGGHGNPLKYSCLGNPMDRGAWRATVHGVTKDQTQQLNNNNLVREGGWVGSQFVIQCA